MVIPENETRQRILDTADELFSSRGFKPVRLRDIAQSVGMRHASLYYYAPGGKAELFREVMERNCARHEAGLRQVIAVAGGDFRSRMYAVADWFVSRPPMDLIRMSLSDFQELPEPDADRLINLVFDSLRSPIVAVLEEERSAGRLAIRNLSSAALGLVSLIESVHAIPKKYQPPSGAREVAHELVDMMVDGWLKRE